MDIVETLWNAFQETLTNVILWHILALVMKTKTVDPVVMLQVVVGAQTPTLANLSLMVLLVLLLIIAKHIVKQKELQDAKLVQT